MGAPPRDHVQPHPRGRGGGIPELSLSRFCVGRMEKLRPDAAHLVGAGTRLDPKSGAPGAPSRCYRGQPVGRSGQCFPGAGMPGSGA